MNIKENEIRSGNIFRDNNTGKDVVLTFTITHYSAGTVALGMMNNIVNLSPTVLTEEWLLKFGFKNVDDEIDFSQWRINDEIPFQIFGNGSDRQEPFNYALEFDHDEKLIEIKHVHQLQNLYFALTGEELTIKELQPNS